MNKIRRRFASTICAALICFGTFVAVPVLIVGCTGGCKTSSKNTLIVSGVTHTTVATGVRAWNEHIKQVQKEVDLLAQTDPAKAHKRGAEATNEIAQVKSAYEKYQASQMAVLTAAQELARIQPSDTNAPAAQDRLTQAVAASSVILSEVVKLLENFGIAVE